MAIPNHISKILKTIPNSPGVYQYYDKNGSLLYIGKAKNLKQRVSSYFTKTQKIKKTRVLISKIQNIEYITVETEMDALLLENNLIKKHQPKYNVMLKDGKTYPWICIKNEPFPRVIQTRSIIDDGSEYFGPYISVYLVKTVLDFFHQLYPLRTCSLNLTSQNIINKKFAVCLEYHMKNCLGPCINNQKKKDYLVGINHIRQIITGDIKLVLEYLKKKMQALASNLEYEKANDIKKKITLLNKYQSKSTIVNPKITDVDVFTVVKDEDIGFVNFLKIKAGAIIQSHTLEIKIKLDETEEELLEIAITELRQKFKSTSKNIYCSHSLKNNWGNLPIITPKIGDKKKLIELSLKNAKHRLIDKKQRKKNQIKRKDSGRILSLLQKDLRLKTIPNHIECFDNSNIQGINAVAACVVFKNAKPSKKDYRHFNIKTVNGPNDFASMEEVIFRRYKKVLKEKNTLPDLIIVDGGKGQLSSAIKSLHKLNLVGKIPVIGIAKRLEEIYFPEDKIPIYLDKRSESLRLIQQLRNEAHRFGIAHHRNIRSRVFLKTSLDKIKGIGPKTVTLLISHFGSVKKVLEANEQELIKLIGINKARKIIK